MKIKKWEYMVYQISKGDFFSILFLNKLELEGKNGWELATTVIDDYGDYNFYFKREIKE